MSEQTQPHQHEDIEHHDEYELAEHHDADIEHQDEQKNTEQHDEHSENEKFVIDYQPVSDENISYQIVHRPIGDDVGVEQHYLKAHLLGNEQYALSLRQTLQQWRCGEKIQAMTAKHPIERARRIVALLDYALYHQQVQRILVGSYFGKMLEQVSDCLELHSQVQYAYFNALQSFDALDWQQAPIYLGRYQDFLQWYGREDLDLIFQHFDLVVLDEIDLEQNQLFNVLTNKYYTGWQWHIYLETPKRLAL